MTALRAGLVVAAMGLLAACTGPHQGPGEASHTPVVSPAIAEPGRPDPGVDLPPWKDRLEATLDPSATGIASGAQDILRPSLQTGVVTRAQVDAAADNAAVCLENAGFGSTMHRPRSDYAGYAIDVHMQAGGELSPSELSDIERLIDACLDEHFYAVEELYLLQPRAVEAQESAEVERFDQYKVALFECLSRTPFAVDEDAPRFEYLEAAAEDLLARESASCHVTTGFLTAPSAGSGPAG